MKKKIVLSIAFIISLLPMFLKQYGGAKGVQEITGLINLLNPIDVYKRQGMPGKYVPLKETLRGFRMILNGECEDVYKRQELPLPILLLRKRKLRHSLGKPSRSDFVQLEVINIFANIPYLLTVHHTHKLGGHNCP